MFPVIKDILFATDLSKNSMYVLRFAVSMAKIHGAKLHVLNVFEYTPAVDTTILMFMGQGAQSKMMEERKGDLAELIGKRLEAFIKQGLQDEPAAAGNIDSTKVEIGDPVTKILLEAERLNSDIIIMGTHSKGPVGHAFLGSTAEKVLRRSQRPVIIIPNPLEKESDF